VTGAALQVADPEIGADALALIDRDRRFPVEDTVASLVSGCK
jgi:LuxR family transcriptional regulator, maltose regulon positive regulatory protein